MQLSRVENLSWRLSTACGEVQSGRRPEMAEHYILSKTKLSEMRSE